MGFTIKMYVRCMHCRREERVHSTNERKMNEEARKMGWRSFGLSHYCPKPACRAEHKRLIESRY